MQPRTGTDHTNTGLQKKEVGHSRKPQLLYLYTVYGRLILFNLSLNPGAQW